MAGDLRLEPEATLGAVDLLRDIQPFRLTWPEVTGCLDDPVAAAVAEFGDRLRAVVAETQAALDELADGAKAAVATFEQAERRMTDGLVAATEQIAADSTQRAIPVAT